MTETSPLTPEQNESLRYAFKKTTDYVAKFPVNFAGNLDKSLTNKDTGKGNDLSIYLATPRMIGKKNIAPYLFSKPLADMPSQEAIEKHSGFQSLREELNKFGWDSKITAVKPHTSTIETQFVKLTP